MKISSIRIKGYKQFDDLFLDFTNPETGRAVDKICFIGKNGTGKSTLLELLSNVISSLTSSASLRHHKYILVKFEIDDKSYYWFKWQAVTSEIILFKTEIEAEEDWHYKLANKEKSSSIVPRDSIFNKYRVVGAELKMLTESIKFINNSSDLLIYSPSESAQNSYLQIADVPNSNLNSALGLFTDFPYKHLVSDQTASDFWRMLIFLIKRRENEREMFELKNENIKKTKEQLIREFSQTNPRILDKLADIWNKILSKAGLEFDKVNANNPIQLMDNLKAYIVLKDTKEKIAYSQLSTGIRNFIFRVGHIYSLYFNREIEKGFLFLDEPENSLFPDFLYDIISLYQGITKNTQLFVATHSPIVASQFEPYERIILDFDDKAKVTASKGVSPLGDDPNDLLDKDFGVRSLLGEEGIKNWERFLELKRLIKSTTNPTEKSAYADEFLKIGNTYNFPLNGVS